MSHRMMGMSNGDPGPDAGLKGQEQSAEHAFELLDSALNGAIALRVINRGTLRHGLDTELLSHPSAQIYQRWLAVRLKEHFLLVAQAYHIGRSLVNGLRVATTLAHHPICHGNPGVAVFA